MRWRVLGPLQVLDDAGAELVLPEGRPRSLLAALLAQPNKVVSLDSLVADMGDGAPPDNAAKTARVHIRGLRRALGTAAERIVTRAPGYLVRVEDGELDARDFPRSWCAPGTGHGLNRSSARRSKNRPRRRRARANGRQARR